MTYSDAEKRVAAGQYSEAVKARWSETGNAIDAFPSVGIDLQLQVNRQQREIEEAVRIIRKGFGEGCLEDFSALEESAFAWFARNTEAK